MSDLAINDAKTSCKHEGQQPGTKCAICGKEVQPNPSAMPEEWKGDANSRKKNA